MAGTIVANTLNTDTGVFSTNNAYSGIASAWVNFSCPSSTVTVNASLNVSSVTRSASGQYVINFNTALADANYTLLASCYASNSGYPAFSNNVYGVNVSIVSSSQCYVMSHQTNTAQYQDNSYVSVAAFR